MPVDVEALIIDSLVGLVPTRSIPLPAPVTTPETKWYV